jgi:hypothetical protein
LLPVLLDRGFVAQHTLMISDAPNQCQENSTTRALRPQVATGASWSSDYRTRAIPLRLGLTAGGRCRACRCVAI